MKNKNKENKNRKSKNKKSFLEHIIPFAILFSFLSTVFFGFLLYGTIKSYLGISPKRFIKAKSYIVKLFNEHSEVLKETKKALTKDVKLEQPSQQYSDAGDDITLNDKSSDIPEELLEENNQTQKSILEDKSAETKPIIETDTPSEKDILQTKDKSENETLVLTQEEKPKAKGVTIVYTNPNAKSVNLVGSFSVWKPIEMTFQDGVWKAKVYLFSGKYKYNFEVDGKRIFDPSNPLMSEKSSILIVD
ncbi:MAG TPA: hypothetical protein VMW66_04680 [Elusimicrobiales bacterium]|nr:hypothetical protein [Elusimicrobiales bacterium]